MRAIITFIVVAAFGFEAFAQEAVIYSQLCENIEISNLCKPKADSLFRVISTSSAFDWTDENNNCEDRANAVSLILDSWGIPNGKAWIFQGSTFDEDHYRGTLGGYTYHVAACILVRVGAKVDTLIIDPLMFRSRLMALMEWCDSISTNPTNVCVITSNVHYQQSQVAPNPNWKSREDYFEETIDGLTRYNNFSAWTRLKTKHYLKKRRSRVLAEYNRLIAGIPSKISSVECR